MAKKCKNKYRFKIWNEAQKFADTYRDDIALSFNPMRPYWCDKHELWHIGHDIRDRMEYTGNGARILPNTDRPKVLSENDAGYSTTTRKNESESSDSNGFNSSEPRNR
tara:strand:- start:1497 stop:1820 length:324 start_codon:yes stop_codon:yes gene_type:complete